MGVEPQAASPLEHHAASTVARVAAAHMGPAAIAGECRDGANGRRPKMNGTTIRKMQLRSLAQRMADAHSAAAQQTVERETAIRRGGIAHPRSIRASRRLNRTLSDHRRLIEIHRQL